MKKGIKQEIKDIVIMLKGIINENELLDISDTMILNKSVELFIFKNGESCKLDGTASFGEEEKIENGEEDEK